MKYEGMVMYFWDDEFENDKFESDKFILCRPVVFLGFLSFAQNQNFSRKFWAKTQNHPKLKKS